MDAADIASRHPDMVTPPGNVLTKPRTNACKRHALAQLDSSSVCKESLLRQRLPHVLLPDESQVFRAFHVKHSISTLGKLQHFPQGTPLGFHRLQSAFLTPAPRTRICRHAIGNMAPRRQERTYRSYTNSLFSRFRTVSSHLMGAKLTRTRAHLVALVRPGMQIDGKHLIGQRQRPCRADVDTATAFHASSRIMPHTERAVRILEFLDGLRRTEGGAHLARRALLDVDDHMAPQARAHHDVVGSAERRKPLQQAGTPMGQEMGGSVPSS